MSANDSKLVQALTVAYELGLRLELLPTPVAGEPKSLDVIEHRLGPEARAATAQLLSAIDEAFEGFDVSVWCGGALFILHREYVAQWLVHLRQLGDDSRQAAARFLRFVAADKVSAALRLYIHGIEIRRLIAITAGIQLERPSPPSHCMSLEERRNWAGSLSFRTACLSKATELDIYICKYKAGSVEGLKRYQDEKRQEFVLRRFREQELQMRHLKDALCIVTAGPILVQDFVVDFDIKASPLALVRRAPRGAGFPLQRTRSASQSQMSEQTCRRYLSLYLQAPENLLRAIQIPISRLNQYYARLEDIEAAIDLGIALEVLFASDRSPDAPVGYLLRMRGALWLGGGAMRRKRHFDILKKAYDLRSQAAHTGTLRKPHTAATTMDKAAILAVVAIRRMLAGRRRPDDWEEWMLRHFLSESTQVATATSARSEREG
jgi:hypothetical protein